MTEATDFTDEDMAAVGRATMAAIKVHANIGWAPADCPSEIVGDLRNDRDELAAEIERLRGCLLWLLWRHQGASSPTGQPIRRALGIEQHAPMTEAQIEAGQRFGVGA